MAATILDGNKVSREMRSEMKRGVEELLSSHGLTPGLGVVLVGDDPASQVYVRNKEKACQSIGIYSREHKLPQDTSQEELLGLIASLNQDSKVHGILVQLPLPRHLDEGGVILGINPEKDVDGLHPVNVGRMMMGEPGFLSCTPHGVQQLLLRSGVEVSGKHVVVVGRSNLVGKPMAAILLQKKEGANATVTVCHTGTSDITQYTKGADILIVAAGNPEAITGDMVSEGVVVVDVGITRVDDPEAKKGYRLVGDVHYQSVSPKASALSPVPGGVGPMTITMLLHNTIVAAKMSAGIA